MPVITLLAAGAREAHSRGPFRKERGASGPGPGNARRNLKRGSRGEGGLLD